jgi:nucleotide-binding universal stress UspA family protein
MSTNEIDLQRILVAYDFSRQAVQALSLGLSLAQEYQTELYLMYVQPPGTLTASDRNEDLKEPEFQHAVGCLSGAVPPEASDWCTIKEVLAEGDPAQEIIWYAATHEIDLICIGSKADDQIVTRILGATTDRVVRGAPCPVLVSRPSYAVPIAKRALASVEGTHRDHEP